MSKVYVTEKVFISLPRYCDKMCGREEMPLKATVTICAVLLTSCGPSASNGHSSPVIKSDQAYRLQVFPGLAGVPGATSAGLFADVMEAVAEDIRTGKNSATSHLLGTGELLQIEAGDVIFVTDADPSNAYVRGWMRSGKLDGKRV